MISTKKITKGELPALTTTDIADSTNKRYITDAEQTVLQNTSNTNTGDNAANTLYSGLVTNATHTGDATGSTALTVVRINGTQLSTLGTGLLKNTTGTGVPSIAVSTDITGTLSAGSIANDKLANGAVANLTGTNSGDNAANTNYANDYRAANFVAGTNYQVPLVSGTTIKTVNSTTLLGSGNVAVATTTQGTKADNALPAASFTDVAVNGKLLTGYVSGSGTVAATDSILQGINKLNGNVALKANTNSPTFTGTVVLPAAQIINGITLSTAQGVAKFLAGDGNYKQPIPSGTAAPTSPAIGDLWIDTN